MSSDVSGLATLRSFRRSFKWAHAKAINLLHPVKASNHQTLRTVVLVVESIICVQGVWTNEGATAFTILKATTSLFFFLILNHTPWSAQRDVYQHKHIGR